ncbi:TrmH family RNA methyltransferase [Ereboglobus sp. PH5-5]|uniref:TrmH family RNA methyltransferase n=1 Tax=Ereboglobus sp. PH5-5 TaxID=2940529 RepID=UPI00240670B3|nr:RNA methyltransferase [Ereboglobus sp. PH5-5]MDF9831934.1 TrmH family RNA methyltransferase [Ereboglobus sp. PH5-5]
MLSKTDIARIRSLREKKHREALGLFVVEGEKVIAELLREKFPFLEIYATPSSPLAKNATPVTEAEMARISHYPTPGAALAVGPIARPTLADNELARGLTLALDDIQDPGNVGTLLRIADWFAFDRVVCSPGCADLFSQKVINASMGSFARVRAVATPLAPVLIEAAQADTPVLGCDLGGGDVHELEPLHNAVVVVGSEGRGLTPEVRATVTRLVTIPRHGRAESLNAAIAAAIVADNLRRAQS